MCEFCNEYEYLKRLHKSIPYCKHVYKAVLMVDTYKDGKRKSRELNDSTELRYCPKCGRRLNKGANDGRRS